MDTTYSSSLLKEVERAPELLEGQVGERLRGAHEGSKCDVG